MAEIREEVAHTLSEAEVRSRMGQALAHYQKEHPGMISLAWKSPQECEVTVSLTPMTKLKGTIAIGFRSLFFIVRYPDIYNRLPGGRASIQEYVTTFRNEIQKWISPKRSS